MGKENYHKIKEERQINARAAQQGLHRNMSKAKRKNGVTPFIMTSVRKGSEEKDEEVNEIKQTELKN